MISLRWKAAGLALLAAGSLTACGATTSAAWQPNPISIAELPLPPTAPSTAAGSCTTAINPHGTGCLDPGPEAITGPGQLPDSRFVLVDVTFAGASSTSVYTGQQTIVVRTDGRTFPDGDAWKCLTCGVPAGQRLDLNADVSTYPQGFPDGKRVLIGANILDCGRYEVTDPRCTPDQTHIYPIRWNTTADGSGPGGSIRELRLNPDGVHLGFNHAVITSTTYDEFAFVGRLVFDPAPATGAPAAPRYDLASVTELFNPAPQYQPYQVESGNRLVYTSAGLVGEFRGWSADGRSTLGIQSFESDNIDAFATGLDGHSRPVTRDAEYTDPIRMSPDGSQALAMEVAGSGRLDFISALDGIPPITDQLPTTGDVSGIRNNGDRRFFYPYLVDARTGHGLRLSYDGDPSWNGRADPSWLADDTGVVWWESEVTAPACGTPNPLPCPVSHEPGARRTRLLIARFTNRTPQPVRHIPPIPDTIAWGTPYVPGETLPTRPHLPAGAYTLTGTIHGWATVTVKENSTQTADAEIAVTYHDYTDDGRHIINGTESALSSGSALAPTITLHENLRVTGVQTGGKVTSEPAGFVLSPSVLQNDFQATGTLTTTIDGRTYAQPANGT